MGQMYAQVALDPRNTLTFPELLAQTKFYMGASSDTIRKIRDAGNSLLSDRSCISMDYLFSDDAYRVGHSITSKEAESMVSHKIEDSIVTPLIYKAYKPPGQPYHPPTETPSYLRG